MCFYDEIFDIRGVGCCIEIFENFVVGIVYFGFFDSSCGYVF